MLSNNSPLSIATTVLAGGTIEAVRRSPSFHARAWQILDRWAFNSPMELRQIEAEGEIILLERLLIQQELEHQILCSEGGLIHQRHGLTEHETLALHGVSGSL
ncbi:hypothetical protein D3880_00595 [Pseudomonas cavernae]|uniref:Uncharacterized protein n=1 Tax=Pseudomonas cavernae TaxID=2320867 RepID=A0A385YZG3_9PSED|nr:hypothetical protein [Pseudomonas cavernae]AYC30973.1 hypothetical protein D3880_00595 [Pseudomonas cavernae]